MSIVADPVAGEPVSECFALLRAESDGFEQLLNQVFADVESMCAALDEQQQRYDARCQRLEEEKQQLAQRLSENPSQEVSGDSELDAKVAELEQDRQSLEQELEEVRSRAAELAKTVAEQKRQMVEERAELTAELRQLRRVLDKQASWIAQQAQQPAAIVAGAPDGAMVPATPVQQMPMLPAAPAGYSVPTQPPANRDPVLGSVLSQFELLRKDLERRRAPPKLGGTKNVNAS